jgi:hypothetical protein
VSRQVNENAPKIAARLLLASALRQGRKARSEAARSGPASGYERAVRCGMLGALNSGRLGPRSCKGAMHGGRRLSPGGWAMAGLRFCAYQYQHLPLVALQQRWREAERAGFDVLWNCDTVVEPDRPRHVMFDGPATLTLMAAATTRIRVGTLVTSVYFRHPVTSAKAAMTLDHLSGGRVEIALTLARAAAHIVGTCGRPTCAHDRHWPCAWPRAQLPLVLPASLRAYSSLISSPTILPPTARRVR